MGDADRREAARPPAWRTRHGQEGRHAPAPDGACSRAAQPCSGRGRRHHGGRPRPAAAVNADGARARRGRPAGQQLRERVVDGALFRTEVEAGQGLEESRPQKSDPTYSNDPGWTVFHLPSTPDGISGTVRPWGGSGCHSPPPGGWLTSSAAPRPSSCPPPRAFGERVLLDERSSACWASELGRLSPPLTPHQHHAAGAVESEHRRAQAVLVQSSDCALGAPVFDLRG